MLPPSLPPPPHPLQTSLQTLLLSYWSSATITKCFKEKKTYLQTKCLYQSGTLSIYQRCQFEWCHFDIAPLTNAYKSNLTPSRHLNTSPLLVHQREIFAERNTWNSWHLKVRRRSDITPKLIV